MLGVCDCTDAYMHVVMFSSIPQMLGYAYTHVVMFSSIPQMLGYAYMHVVMLSSISQMLGYACVAEYFSQPDTSAYLWLLSEELEGDTNALQALLGEGVG